MRIGQYARTDVVGQQRLSGAVWGGRGVHSYPISIYGASLHISWSAPECFAQGAVLCISQVPTRDAPGILLHLGGRAGGHDLAAGRAAGLAEDGGLIVDAAAGRSIYRSG